MENRPNPTLPEWSSIGAYTILRDKIHGIQVIDSKEVQEGDLVLIHKPFSFAAKIGTPSEENNWAIEIIEANDFTPNPDMSYSLSLNVPNHSIWRINKTPIH